ncbi:MAG TPA: hypothetical protein VIL16_27295, partial [Trebonia sp.]
LLSRRALDLTPPGDPSRGPLTAETLFYLVYAGKAAEGVGLMTAAAGSSVGLAAVLLSGHSLVAAVCSGVVAGIAVLAAMYRYQRLVWERALARPLIISEAAESR